MAKSKLQHFGISKEDAAALEAAGLRTPKLIAAASDQLLISLIGEESKSAIRIRIG